MATKLTVEDVKRDKDENGAVVWVKIKVLVDGERRIKEYTATFMQSGRRVKRIWYPGKDHYIPKDIYNLMARKAYAIIFDKRQKEPEQPNFPQETTP